ncbi:hypothetical protein [Bacterioplanes sanyensis]|uniref:hypothetical protein n=1 Tax=Bacterioplanes sanyensis TaxID=1249553 RepID=UPI0012FE3E60|nr:hypothetical protein [Bacterioplanes sanyensis]
MSAIFNFEYVGVELSSVPRKIQLAEEYDVRIQEFYDSEHDSFFEYMNYGAYQFGSRLYVKTYMTVKDDAFSRWVAVQEERLSRGLRTRETSFHDLIYIDPTADAIYSVNAGFDHKNRNLNFSALGCLQDHFIFHMDVNGDSIDEFFMVKGYESGVDFRFANFNHSQVYLASGSGAVLFRQWMKNIDYSVSGGVVSGLAEGRFDIVDYDGYESMVEKSRSGIKRYFSLFFFADPESGDQGVLSWSKVYRNKPDKPGRFEFSNEEFQWARGNVVGGVGFHQESISSDLAKQLLSRDSLSFEDGLNEARLCKI